ncbi:hypothetical protein DSL72_007115 [Monilinia vaccinii-corymbosi]|uniref:Uncharacterized protein n=1 Tax=Monilinia vaccinii-corymbosi TaxID=61207 RepID=A0A8A3PLW6_9HELO|nr:hypothetical protein DSL72_007115 [Monilinia vaccinii-corymbosi]
MHDCSPGSSSSLPHQASDITHGVFGAPLHHCEEDCGGGGIMTGSDAQNRPPPIAKRRSFDRHDVIKVMSDLQRDSTLQSPELMIRLGLSGTDDAVHIPHVVRWPDESSRRDTA